MIQSVIAATLSNKKGKAALLSKQRLSFGCRWVHHIDRWVVALPHIDRWVVALPHIDRWVVALPRACLEVCCEYSSERPSRAFQRKPIGTVPTTHHDEPASIERRDLLRVARRYRIAGSLDRRPRGI
jgi:hypothetical protein